MQVVRSEKLDPPTELGILVDYDGEKMHRIWIPSRKGNILLRSSNVKFDEMVNSVSHHQNRDDMSSNSNDGSQFENGYYFDNVPQRKSINKSKSSKSSKFGAYPVFVAQYIAGTE